MNIAALCAVGVVASVLAIALRRENPETALMISLGAGAMILLGGLRLFLSGYNRLSVLLAQTGISYEYILVLLKVLGICFLTEFSCDCAHEAGMDALCSNLSLSGKILVIVTALPLFSSVLELVRTLTGG